MKDNDEIWSLICENSENLLSVLVDILLAWDKSQLKNIYKSIETFKETLTHIFDIKSVQHLPQAFSVILFNYFLPYFNSNLFVFCLTNLNFCP